MTAPPTAEPRIAVIGGGISGLAAAHRITELAPAAQVTLLEASDRLGGVIRTVRQDGFLIEGSADSFITATPWAVELCRRIGFAEQLIPTDPQQRGAMVVAHGKLEPVPEGFLLMSAQRLGPLLRSPILSLRGKLRLACERFVTRRSETHDESVASFARRRLGREAFERLVQPLVGGIYTADPEKLSLSATFPRFIEMEQRHGSLIRAAKVARAEASKNELKEPQSDESGARYSMFVAPRDGLTSLVEAISAKLPANCVRLNSPVQSIERVGEKWRVGCATPEEFDGVIIATPAPAAARLLLSVDEILADELAEIEHAGSAIVVLAYDRSQIAHRLNGFGFVVPTIERRKILSASFSSVKFPGRAPEGKVLIRVFLGGALQAEMLNLPDDQLRRIAEEELRDLLGVSGSPCLSLVFRWPASMPQFYLGHVLRLEYIRERLSQLPVLALAGNAYEGVGIPQCIRSGEAAAEKVAAAVISR